MNKFKKIVVSVLFAVCMTNTFAFEQGQSAESVKNEIHQKLNANVSVTKVYQGASQTGLSKQLVATMIMMEAHDVKQAIESLFLTDLPPKTVFSIASSLGIKSDVVLAAALNSGVPLDALFSATASGGDQGDSGFSISRASSAFGATPASSFSGGGGSAASRN